MISKIISGGQTGADRAGLDIAVKYGFPHGGWCPKGRKAEDGAISWDYALEESPSSNYLQRTEWNARDTDGTVIFTLASAVTGGSKRTIDFVRKHTKPWLHLHPKIDGDPATLLHEFVERHRIQTLNVAGSRGSKEPELYAWVCEVLKATFFATDAQRAMAAALHHLGPDIEVTSIKDNANEPLGYNEKKTDNCWRVFYRRQKTEIRHAGGADAYILIEKEAHSILGHGVEHGE
jgi:hypothetical protein